MSMNSYLRGSLFSCCTPSCFREAELLAAASRPLFSQPGRQKTTREKYPNVYDKQADAMASSSFISGTKVGKDFFVGKLKKNYIHIFYYFSILRWHR